MLLSKFRGSQLPHSSHKMFCCLLQTHTSPHSLPCLLEFESKYNFICSAPVCVWKKKSGNKQQHKAAENHPHGVSCILVRVWATDGRVAGWHLPSCLAVTVGWLFEEEQRLLWSAGQRGSRTVGLDEIVKLTHCKSGDQKHLDPLRHNWNGNC